MLVSVLLLDDITHQLARVKEDLISVDHLVDGHFDHVVKGLGVQVQADGAGLQDTPGHQQQVHVQGGHVGLGPPITPVFNILLKLQPSEREPQEEER